MAVSEKWVYNECTSVQRVYECTTSVLVNISWQVIVCSFNMDPTGIYKELASRQASYYCLRKQIILNAIVI